MKAIRLFLLLAIPAAAFDLSGLANLFGNLSSSLFPGATASRAKSIAPTFFEPGGGPGKIVGNVNIYNGQPVYSGITLGTLNVRGILSYSLDLFYGGPTKGIVESDNRKAPTGWTGLGFDLSTPFVAVNDKGTFASGDDALFCNLGPYGGGQILQSAGGAFYLSKNPFIRIQADQGTGDFAGQWIRWTFIFPDGKRMIFGRDSAYAGDAALRTISRTGPLLKSSPNASIPDQRFIYRWDLRAYQDASGANRILFDYAPSLEPGLGGRSYVRESHVRNIRWFGLGGQEAERFEFTTLTKGPDEYSGYAFGEPRDDQKLFETRALDSIKSYKEGRLTMVYKMNWQVTGGKRLLTRVQPFFPNPGGGFQRDSGWVFTYEDRAHFLLLHSVTLPSGRIDRFEYGQVGFKDAVAQDRSTYSMLDPALDTLRLPTDNAKVAAWKNESFCDERFCWLVAKDGDDDPGPTGKKHNIYVEVKRNMGDFFDSLPDQVFRTAFGDDQTPADRLRFLSGGNYFLLVDERQGIVNLWEWNGVTFLRRDPFAGDSRYDAAAGFGGEIAVFPSSNYFLIWKKGSPSQVIPVLRQPSGQWASLNRNPSACDLSNKLIDYGESVRDANSPACLEWSSPNLLFAVMGSFFVVNHQETDVFNAYAMNPSGTGFVEISRRFAKLGVPQRAGFPMNMDTEVDRLVPASDYFLFASHLGSGFDFQAVYFDGDSLRAAGGVTGAGNGPFRLFASGDYFLQANNQGGISFWRKTAKANAAGGDSIGFEARPIPGRSDLPDPQTADLQVRTHPSGFTIEYYSPGEIGFRPLADAAQPDQYAAYLYQVSRAFPDGFQERTGSLTVNGKRLYDVSFSFSDDMLSGTYAFAKDDQGLCRTGHDCTISEYTARTFPESPGTYLNAPIQVVLPGFQVGNGQGVMSGSARLGQFSALDKATRQVVYRLYQFDGESYNAPANQWVVRRTVSSSGQTPETGANTRTFRYDYDKPDFSDPTASLVEFNTHLQLPQFESCVVTQEDPTGASIGSTRTVMNLDMPSRPLSGPSSSLIGMEKNSVTFGLQTLMMSNTYSVPFRDPAWPEALYINRLDSTAARAIAPNFGRQTRYLRYFNFNRRNGAPQFTLYDFPRLPGSAGLPYTLKQTIFDPDGLPRQTLTYVRSAIPDFNQLNAADPTAPYSTQEVVQSAKIVDSAFLEVRDSLWRDADPALTVSDLKSGTSPRYDLSRGWFLNGAVTQFNDFTQPLERKVEKDKTSVGASYTSAFYEGLRSDPVGQVWNSRLDNCAILMAENGDAALAPGLLDVPGRWNAGGAAFSPDQAHTGRYAFRVADNAGPNTRLYLKDAVAAGYGYKVSAWFYSSGTVPVLTVERRNAAGALIGSVTGSPASGAAFAPNQWQRWEAVFTNAQLLAGGLFAPGAGDYLAVKFGTGAPAGDPSRVLYVDDIACYPSLSEISMATFDYRGSKTSSTGSSQRTAYFDLGFRGEPIAVRDEHYRIFDQSATHQMGENP